MHSELSQRLLRLVLAAALLAAGCSDSSEVLPRAAVHGTVRLDGLPLSRGVIRFTPVEGSTGPKISVMVDAGMFSVDEQHGPVVGTHRIEIESSDDGGYARDDEQALERLKASGATRIEVVQVPAAYNVRSDIEKTVTSSGPNEFHFDLTTPKR